MKKSAEMMRLDRDLKNDPELAKNFKEAVKEAAQSGTCKNDIEVIALAAKSFGYEISIGEMERSAAAKEELDPEEMKQVAGGDSECDYVWQTDHEDEYGHNNWCMTAWHCQMVTLHTETESKHVRCFSDYLCDDMYNCSYFSWVGAY